MYRGRSLLAGLASAVAVVCLLPAAASAAIINVTTQSDETNSSDGLCSLREAITSSNNSASPDPACPDGSGDNVIVLPASANHYAVTGAAGENANASGDFDITTALEIQGAGASSTVIDGGHNDRVFDVTASGGLIISGVTITNGKTPDGGNGSPGPAGAPNSTGGSGSSSEDGGAIRTAAPVSLSHVVVTGNATGNGGIGGVGGAGANGGPDQPGGTSTGGLGGASGKGGGIAIAAGGALLATDSSITQNSTGSGGQGGGAGQGGTGGSPSSTGAGLSGGNTNGGTGGSSGFGGGINSTGGAITLTRSVVSGNTIGTAGTGGGGGTGGTGGTATTTGNGGDGGVSFGGGGGFAGQGGAVRVVGTLTATDSTIQDNHAGTGGQGGTGGTGGTGGAGAGGGTNGSPASAIGGGGGQGGMAGGIQADTGTAGARTLSRTAIIGNTAGDGGDGGAGGTAVASGAPGGLGGPGGDVGGYAQQAITDSSLTNVTIAQNAAGAGGKGGTHGSGGGQVGNGGHGGNQGGVEIDCCGNAAIDLSHATIASNLPGAGGAPGDSGPGSTGANGTVGGINVDGSAVVSLVNSIVAENGTGPNCAGTFSGTNTNDLLFPATDTSCPATVKADPVLGAPQDNGGLTPTMALGIGSAALDAVPSGDSACTSAGTDQRGIARPKGAGCDIGAFELARPTAATGGSSLITTHSAGVTGTVNPSERATSYRYQFGKTTAYGSLTAPVSAGSGSTNVAAPATLTGLAPNTTYHYRLVAANGDGIAVGTDRTFKTAPPPFKGVSIVTTTAKVSKAGKAKISLSCPASTIGRCDGTLALRITVKSHGKKKRVTIGTATFTIRHARTAAVKVALSSFALKRLAKKGTLTATAIAKAHDGLGRRKTTIRNVLLTK